MFCFYQKPKDPEKAICGRTNELPKSAHHFTFLLMVGKLIHATRSNFMFFLEMFW